MSSLGIAFVNPTHDPRHWKATVTCRRKHLQMHGLQRQHSTIGTVAFSGQTMACDAVLYVKTSSRSGVLSDCGQNSDQQAKGKNPGLHHGSSNSVRYSSLDRILTRSERTCLDPAQSRLTTTSFAIAAVASRSQSAVSGVVTALAAAATP